MSAVKKILAYVAANPGLGALRIAKHFERSRKEINRLLYRLQREGKVRRSVDNPPQWYKTCEPPSDEKTSSSPSTSLTPVAISASCFLSSSVQRACKHIIVVDLGNVHDVLPGLDKLSLPPSTAVWAFADWAYAGYGVRPASPSVSVLEQAEEPRPNAADMLLAHRVWRYCWEHRTGDRGVTFHVVTKDVGVHTLKDIVHRDYRAHTVVFYSCWSTLQNTKTQWAA